MTRGCRPLALFRGPVDEEFLCPVSRGVLVRPVRGPCNHEYCAYCIECRLLSGETACPDPSCGVELSMDTLSDAPKTARLLEKLVAACDNDACDWVGPWSQLPQHRLQSCDFESLRCPFNGCIDIVLRKELPSHKEECLYRTVQCGDCCKPIKFCDVDYHNSRCPLKVLACPQSCGEELTRASIENHVQEACPNTHVPCPFVSMGCDAASIPRGTLSTHLSTSIAHHLDTLARELIAERQQHAKELAELQSEVKRQSATFDREFMSGGKSVVDVVQNLRKEVSQHKSVIERFLSGSTLVVDSMGCGLFKTITEALTLATPGDTILVRPGVYNESLVMTKDVWIRGAAMETVIVVPLEGSAVVFRATARVSNLTLRQTSSVAQCVTVKAGTPVIEDCDISSENLSSVVVSGGTPEFKRCAIHGSKQHGVDWRSKEAGGSIVDCDIHTNQQPNIVVEAHGSPNIVGCKIHDGGVNGVWVKPRATPRIQGCDLYANNFSNIDVMANAAPHIEDNDIRGSKKCGVCVAEGGMGTITNNRIRNNEYSNVAVLPNATPIITFNTISGSRQHGIFFKSGAGGVCHGNKIEGNALSAMGMEGPTTVDFSQDKGEQGTPSPPRALSISTA